MLHAIFIAGKMNSMNSCPFGGFDVFFRIVKKYAVIRYEGEFSDQVLIDLGFRFDQVAGLGEEGSVHVGEEGHFLFGALEEVSGVVGEDVEAVAFFF